ncbi:MAG: DUF2958 domain-containing protein [Pseudomonadota bacterium]
MNEQAINVEAASTQTFAPYGEILLPPSGEPVYRGIQASTWPTGFRCDDEVRLMYTRFGWQEPVFAKLERHQGVTQTFVALAPRSFVMVVAAATDDDVWHALDRFLLEPEPLDCLMLTSSGVQAELEAQYKNGTRPERTDVIDFVPLARLFTPLADSVWLLTEIDPEDADMAFGLHDPDDGRPELGYVSLRDLEGRFAQHLVRRDEYFRTDQPLSMYVRMAGLDGRR